MPKRLSDAEKRLRYLERRARHGAKDSSPNPLCQWCPRCGGSMERIVDLFGEYDDCLNCGYHKDVFSGPPIALKPAEVPGKKTTHASRGPSIGGHSL